MAQSHAPFLDRISKTISAVTQRLLTWSRRAQAAVGSLAGTMLNMVTQTPSGLRTHFGLIIVFSAAINLLYLAPSLYMLQVYDRVIPTSGILTLMLLSVVLLGSLAALAVLDAVRTRLLTRTVLRVERFAADKVMEANMRARRICALLLRDAGRHKSCGDGARS